VSSGGGGLKASPKSGKRRESRPNTIFRKDWKRRCRGRALPNQYGSGFRYTQVEHLLRESANFLTEARNPPGCLFVRGALSCSEAADAIQKELAARRAASEVKLRDRLEVAKDDGKLPPELDPTDYARYLMTVMEGMSVRAAGGATREELHKVADMVLRAWPAASGIPRSRPRSG
jgi:hypothetical protein